MKFKRETDFQETEIGKIPREWKVVKLKAISTFAKRGKTPKYGKSELLIIKTAHNYPDGIRFEEAPHASEEFLANLPKEFYLKPGDILINSTGTGSVGRVGFFEYYHKPCTVDGHITILRINQKLVVSKYVFYYLSSSSGQSALLSKASGSTHQVELYVNEILDLALPLPSLDEQQRIAEILSTVDRAIEVVDAGVARLEGLKKALMRELLTGRIRVREENGKPVFYRETEFQDTEIGKIPREWRIVKLNRIARIIMGQSPPSETYNKDGIGMPFLQGKMEFGRIYPSPVMYTSDPIKIAESNDVLISVRAPVGDVNIAPYRVCIGRGLAAIRFDPNQANYIFFFYYFQSIKERLETLGKGSTFKAITKKDLEELTVVNPPLKEQKSIGEILSTVDRAIELYREERIRLDRLKRGLMDLLLTGKVRVVRED